MGQSGNLPRSGFVQQAYVVGLVFRCAPNQPQMRALWGGSWFLIN
ncbi:hypothetical protein GCM10007877_35060 [Marinibactrum halimedae]|uniref:Uncharacterized protein n=1 Tax=Marinibactrum halimedae TaxID=1444977 RepID=A0AA37WQT3_9GAMM|nr:hypothetical protein GCM10007877_35060 [Marinibactrum halimedae]